MSYGERVRALEAEGLTTSDAQAAVDAEMLDEASMADASCPNCGDVSGAACGACAAFGAHGGPCGHGCDETSADECAMVRERSVAGLADEIPACAVHGAEYVPMGDGRQSE